MTLKHANLIASVFLIAFSSSHALALEFPTTHYVFDVAIGDVNGDGVNDIITCGSLDNRSSVDVLLGNGNGSFQHAIESSVGPGPSRLAVGDFNLDGHLDVVTANFGLDGGFSNTISVLLGYGDGTFQNRHDFVVGGKPNSIVVTDVNGDGYLDFVVGETVKFVILLGDGQGGFQISSATQVRPHSDGVAVGDLNGDGILDIAEGNTGKDVLSVSFGNGDGTFQPVVFTAFNLPAFHPLLMDVNGDGLADLIGTFPDAHNNISVDVNSGDLSFIQEFDTGGGGFIADFVPGDFNNDTKTDFAYTERNPTGQDVLFVVPGNGDGTFKGPISNKVSAGDVIAAGFLDTDSNLDLAGGDHNNLSVHTVYGSGDGTFTAQPPSS